MERSKRGQGYKTISARIWAICKGCMEAILAIDLKQCGKVKIP